MEKKLTDQQQRELDVLVTFLERTRDGTYAQIEESSLPYARMQPMRDDNCSEQTYAYGLR